ncbi:MAG TPA: rod shape-determining protein MreC [bacterium]|nr:rod shape-determining protein MreC [bacterium]
MPMLRLPSKKSSAWLWLIVITLVIFHYLGFLSRPENLISQSIKPIFQFASNNNQSIAKWVDSWQNRHICQDKLVQAEEKNKELTIKTVSLASLIEENENLRKLVDFQKIRQFKLKTANIIYRGQTGGLLAPNQTLIIDLGTKQGLTSDLAVIDQRGNIVGKIGQVKEDSAEVLLVTNKDCRLAAGVASSSKTIGLVRGNLGLTVNLEMVPQTETLQIGQEIVTSGLEPSIPRDLPIGKVESISKENNDLWQSADLNPATDQSELGFVSVIVP